MSQQNTFVRGELSSYFNEVLLQVDAVVSLLGAMEDQHAPNGVVSSQLFGINRLLVALSGDLSKLQNHADELETWAIVSVKRAQEGKV